MQLTARLRRAAFAAGVAVFTVVQVLAPLLHTHVSASAAALQSGIHLPVALVHEGHGHTAVSASEGTLLDEANAITAPPEHRRNDLPPPTGIVMSAPGWTLLRIPTRVAVPADAAPDSSCRSRFLPHPPAQAPPETA